MTIITDTFLGHQETAGKDEKKSCTSAKVALYALAILGTGAAAFGVAGLMLRGGFIDKFLGRTNCSVFVGVGSSTALASMIALCAEQTRTAKTLQKLTYLSSETYTNAEGRVTNGKYQVSESPAELTFIPQDGQPGKISVPIRTSRDGEGLYLVASRLKLVLPTANGDVAVLQGNEKREMVPVEEGFAEIIKAYEALPADDSDAGGLHAAQSPRPLAVSSGSASEVDESATSSLLPHAIDFNINLLDNACDYAYSETGKGIPAQHGIRNGYLTLEVIRKIEGKQVQQAMIIPFYTERKSDCAYREGNVVMFEDEPLYNLENETIKEDGANKAVKALLEASRPMFQQTGPETIISESVAEENSFIFQIYAGGGAASQSDDTTTPSAGETTVEAPLSGQVNVRLNQSVVASVGVEDGEPLNGQGITLDQPIVSRLGDDDEEMLRLYSEEAASTPTIGTRQLCTIDEHVEDLSAKQVGVVAWHMPGNEIQEHPLYDQPVSGKLYLTDTYIWFVHGDVLEPFITTSIDKEPWFAQEIAAHVEAAPKQISTSEMDLHIYQEHRFTSLPEAVSGIRKEASKLHKGAAQVMPLLINGQEQHLAVVKECKLYITTEAASKENMTLTYKQVAVDPRDEAQTHILTLNEKWIAAVDRGREFYSIPNGAEQFMEAELDGLDEVGPVKQQAEPGQYASLAMAYKYMLSGSAVRQTEDKWVLMSSEGENCCELPSTDSEIANHLCFCVEGKPFYLSTDGTKIDFDSANPETIDAITAQHAQDCPPAALDEE